MLQNTFQHSIQYSTEYIHHTIEFIILVSEFEIGNNVLYMFVTYKVQTLAEFVFTLQVDN